MPDEKKFRVTASALFLRSEPVVDRETRIALLPNGQVATKLGEADDPSWWRVSTNHDGQEIEGYVAHRYLAPLTPPGVKGIDVSYHQGAIDWSRVAATDVSFAFIRATYGVSQDKRIDENWRAARETGLLCGAYHFFRNGKDPQAQADAFLNAFASGGYGAGDLPPVIDVEENLRYDPPLTDIAAYIAGVALWIGAVKKALGKTPIIYTLDSYWRELGNPDGFSQNPLWNVDLSPGHITLPNGWSDYTFLQYSFTGDVDGIDTKVDMDEFNGSLDDLKALAG